MKIVISQPMLFPWVGMFEQISLADICVYYVDVQFSKGSLVNRVKIKTAHGTKWLTVPLAGLTLGQSINDTAVSVSEDWKHRHLVLLEQAYAKAPFWQDVRRI